MKTEWTNKDNLEIPQTTAGVGSVSWEEYKSGTSNSSLGPSWTVVDKLNISGASVGSKSEPIYIDEELKKAIIESATEIMDRVISSYGAIPISWIDAYITDCSIDMRNNDGEAIKKMVEDWRESLQNK